MNPVTKALNGGGAGMSDAASVLWGRIIIAMVPVLLLAVGTLTVWVIEIRANRYTAEDHLSHMETHERTIPPREVIQEMERLNQRLLIVEKYLLERRDVP